MTRARGGSAPPALPGWVLERPHLMAALENTTAPVVLLRAPAGYGKTVLAAQWTAHQGARWYDLGMPESLSNLETLEVGTPAVLEHYRSGDAQLDARLETLIRARHPETRLVLIARAVPNLPLERWRLEGRVIDFSPEDLAFRPEEVAQLDLRLEPAAVDALMSRTLGWPAMMRFALESLRNGFEALHGGLSPLRSYLEHEIWDALNLEDQRFLLETSVLDDLNPARCDALLGRSGSGRRCRELVSRGAPIRPPARLGEVYASHPVWLEFLRARLDEDPEWRCDLERRAAQVLAGAGAYIEATGHALAADDWELALSCLQNGSDRASATGRGGLLREYLGRFPEPYRERPELLQVEAYLAWAAGDHALALEKARRASSVTDPDQGAAALAISAGVRNTLGQFEEEVRALETALEVAPQDRLLGAKIHHLLGAAYIRTGRLEDAEVQLNRSLGLFREGEPGFASVLGQSALLYLARGEARTAAHGLERALRISRELGSPRGEAYILYNLSIALNQAGMHQRALEVLSEAGRLAERLGLAYLKALIEREVADTLRDLNDPGAGAAYRGALAALETLNASAGLLHAQHGLAVLHRRRHEPEAALRAAARALEHTGAGEPDFAALVRTHAAFVRGDGPGLLVALRQTLEQPQRHYHVQALLYGMAWFRARGDLEQAESHRRRALAIIEDEGYEHLLEEEVGLLSAPHPADLAVGFAGATVVSAIKPIYRLTLLGRLELHGPDGQLFEHRPKPLEVIAYLGLRRGAAISADQLRDALWPEANDTRGALQTHVWMLRKTLGADVIATSRRGYRFDPDARIELDVEVFGEHLRAGRLEQAIALYRGELLPGLEWSDLERRNLELQYLRALEDLAEREAGAGHLERGIALLERIVEIDPLADEVYRKLIDWNHQAGHETTARRLMREFSRHLEQTLG